jgi:hypothetical protein
MNSTFLGRQRYAHVLVIPNLKGSKSENRQNSLAEWVIQEKKDCKSGDSIFGGFVGVFEGLVFGGGSGGRVEGWFRHFNRTGKSMPALIAV